MTIRVARKISTVHVMSDADKYVNIVTGSIPIFVETVRYE